MHYYNIKKLIIIPILLISLVVTGTSYYVKSAGNDSNSGLSDAQAWAHHPWMSTWTGSVTLTAGDVVFMKNGDTWSISAPVAPYIIVGQSGTAGNYITTTSYGTGAKPIIKISDDAAYPVIRALGKSYIVFDYLDIQHFDDERDTENGQNGIVFGKDASSNVPHDLIITRCDIHNIPNNAIFGYDDSYNITIGNISAFSTATTTVYSNQIYDCGYGGIILLGRNPVTDRSDFNVYFNYVHDIDNSSTINRDAYGISFTSTEVGADRWHSDGWPNYVTARYNYVEDISRTFWY